MKRGWAGRPSRTARGYGAAWVRLRKVILQRDVGMCQPCLREGYITNATQVDHIEPKAKGGSDDPANLQAICDRCAAIKDAIDRGKPLVRQRATIGADGWPK